MKFPENLKYTRDHEWVRVDGDAGIIGITDYAQGELGDIVFVELPPVGRQVQQGETFGTIEAVKAVSDLYAPVSGEVTEVNTKLIAEAELVNKDPYGEGWMIKLILARKDETNNLMDAAKYREMVGK